MKERIKHQIMELGIKGHSTRAKEVIGILKTLGGENRNNVIGDEDKYFYYIDDKYIYNSYIGPDETEGYIIFTLEDFLENFPYKVGDKVEVWKTEEHFSGPRPELYKSEIKSMRWNSARYEVAYRMKDISGEFYKSDIKGKVEEENKPEPKFKVGDTVYSTTWQQDVIIQEIFPGGFYKVSDLQCSGWFKTHEDALRKEKITLPIDSHLLTKQFKQEILLPEGYQFVDDNSNIINTKKIKLVKNAPYYPKTYEECCDVLSMCYATYYNLRYFTYEPGYYEYTTADKLCSLQDKLNILGKLIICRNAYWKIAGEYLGLDKPWEPAMQDSIWGITRSKDEVEKYSCHYGKTYLLEFPTIEMRDVFYNNFKFLIDQCKELL